MPNRIRIEAWRLLAKRLTASAGFVAAVLPACLVCSGGAYAQGAAASRIGTSQVAEARRLLRDPDANVRTAAMENFIFSESLALREVAFDEGFSSADSVIRSLALIGRLSSTETLVFEVVNAKNVGPEEWKKVLVAAGLGDRISFLRFKLEPKTGRVEFYGGNGRLAGQALNLVWGNHALNAKLADGAQLTGTVSIGTATLPVRAPLQ